MEHFVSVSLFETQSLAAISPISEFKLEPSGSFSSQLFLEHFQVNWEILSSNEFQSKKELSLPSTIETV